MAASEAAVNAVMEALGYHGRYMEIPIGQVSCHCGETGWVTRAEYRKHVAVAAADAAVDADRASIQAETLRKAAGVFDRLGGMLTCVGVSLRLDDLATRAEAQP
jgi:phage baseplate assembly protein gpV